MRVAVAGTCGLALMIAREVHESTSHQLIVLSRSVSLPFLFAHVKQSSQFHTYQTLTWQKQQPHLQSQGYQCQVVDYTNPASIQHSLMGVDTVISTVTGNAQLRLIEAAVQCRVRRFAPAEFEGQPALRSQNGLLDRGRGAALALLQHYRAYIQSTVFVCGVFYERFSVNGMMSLKIGVNTGYGNEGDYIADIRNMTATVPLYDSAQNLSNLCLTSAYDVAKFVVRSLDVQSWPQEMSMCGERMSVQSLIDVIQQCRGTHPYFSPSKLWYTNDIIGRQFYNVDWQNTANLEYQMTMAQMAGDSPRQPRLATMIETSESHYDFATPAYLNATFPDLIPITFRDWLTSKLNPRLYSSNLVVHRR
jgi:hypothetical protein